MGKQMADCVLILPLNLWQVQISNTIENVLWSSQKMSSWFVTTTHTWWTFLKMVGKWRKTTLFLRLSPSQAEPINTGFSKLFFALFHKICDDETLSLFWKTRPKPTNFCTIKKCCVYKKKRSLSQKSLTM